MLRRKAEMLDEERNQAIKELEEFAALPEEYE